MSSTLLLILIISFFATLVRSTLGFGEALIAVPLFLFFLPVEIAVPLSVMLSIVVAISIILQDYKNIHFESAKWLIIYAIPGIPIGILILIYGNESLIKIGLGILIILYGLFSLFIKTSAIIKEDSKLWLFIFGFISGIFGGAYGINGPPLIIYGNLRKWSAKHFRATLQAYFLPVSLISLFGYFAKGLITTEVSTYFLYALITSIPAILLGRYLSQQLKETSFFKYVYGGLVVIGVMLIASSMK